MGVEPYLLTGGVRGILNQRLLRRLCDTCKRPAGSAWEASGCGQCGGVGYRGRLLIAELLIPDAEFRRAVLAKADADELEAVAHSSGWKTLRAAADQAVQSGQTTTFEIERVLGPWPK
jgi:type II secretory ATPase GspE/PulE/Tfp pilus assembly ATPase PilB-like protein